MPNILPLQIWIGLDNRFAQNIHDWRGRVGRQEVPGSGGAKVVGGVNFRGPWVALEKSLQRLSILCNDVRAHTDVLIRIQLLARRATKLFPRPVHNLKQTASSGGLGLGRGAHGALGARDAQSCVRVNALGLRRSTDFVRQFLGHGSRSVRGDRPF